MLHSSGGCSTCHGAPNAAAPVFYQNFSPKAASGLAPVHIPSGATPCENCHAVAFTTFSGTTMSAAKHSLLLTDTGGTCDQCHEIGRTFYGVNNLTVRPSTGHGGGRDCNGCHSPNNWGGNAARKTVAAAATKSTVTLVVNAGFGRRNAGDGRGTGIARLSHDGVRGDCASCHNGVLAAGKSAAHIASNAACDNCHTTLAWLPARFDHRGVTASCASCHNGALASGKPTHHVPTTADCAGCHGTVAWSAATFSHAGISASCQSCHNGIVATGKQFQHERTARDCAGCHTTVSWMTAAAPAPLKPLLSKPNPRPAAPIAR